MFRSRAKRTASSGEDDSPELVIIREEKVRQTVDLVRTKQEHGHRMVVTLGALFLLVVTQLFAFYAIYSVGESEAKWAPAAVSSITTAAVAYLFARSRD